MTAELGGQERKKKKGFWAQSPILSRVAAVLIINRVVPWKQLKGQAGGTLSAKYENLQVICDYNHSVPPHLLPAGN